MRALPAAALLLAAIPSCLLVPTPEHGHLSGHGVVDAETAASLRPGEATREEVLLALGEPDASLLDDELFVYTWETVGGYLISQGGGGPLPSRNVFLVQFAPSGKVRRTGRADPGFLAGLMDGSFTTLARQARGWAQKE